MSCLGLPSLSPLLTGRLVPCGLFSQLVLEILSVASFDHEVGPVLDFALSSFWRSCPSFLLTGRLVPFWTSQFIFSFDREVGPVLDISLSSPLLILSVFSFDQEVGPVLDFPLSSSLETLSVLSFDLFSGDLVRLVF